MEHESATIKADFRYPLLQCLLGHHLAHYVSGILRGQSMEDVEYIMGSAHLVCSLAARLLFDLLH